MAAVRFIVDLDREGMVEEAEGGKGRWREGSGGGGMEGEVEGGNRR